MSLLHDSFGDSRGSCFSLQSEETRAGPVGTTDLARDCGQGPPTLSAPLESVLEHQDIMGLTLPFADQPDAGLEPDRPSLLALCDSTVQRILFQVLRTISHIV
ncbi:MAG: hypothetical protein N2C12_17610 [Planctomycetales bacterium]